jgi:hypothetical protein
MCFSFTAKDCARKANMVVLDHLHFSTKASRLGAAGFQLLGERQVSHLKGRIVIGDLAGVKMSLFEMISDCIRGKLERIRFDSAQGQGFLALVMPFDRWPWTDLWFLIVVNLDHLSP